MAYRPTQRSIMCLALPYSQCRLERIVVSISDLCSQPASSFQMLRMLTTMMRWCWAIVLQYTRLIHARIKVVTIYTFLWSAWRMCVGSVPNNLDMGQWLVAELTVIELVRSYMSRFIWMPRKSQQYCRNANIIGTKNASAMQTFAHRVCAMPHPRHLHASHTRM